MNKHQKLPCERTGVLHFLEFVSNGEPEWSLFAINAPLPEVSQKLGEMLNASKRFSHVPLRPGQDSDDLVAPLTALVSCKGSGWTIVFRSLFYVTSMLVKEVPKEARKLSKLCKTQAITFVSEGASSSVAYEIFENGALLEAAEWDELGKLVHFKSRLRRIPSVRQKTDNFPDQLLRARGIYVPCCYPMQDHGGAWLAVEEISVGHVLAADLLEIPKRQVT